MKKHEISKPLANGHIPIFNVVRGKSDNCLIVRYVVFFMENTHDSTAIKGRRNE
jgi:hypothetical protein